ncbi:MAG: hypothetical protein JWN13_4267 [Betaproteobacteria bacterium]|jgi:hypothetical protein|nr:hypothetical protein [Betaproteobacteria bacterium]
MRHRNQERITAPKIMTRAAVRGVVLSALLGAGIALSACTTVGTGSGSLSPGDAPVAFAWKSTQAGMGGTMQATLASGQIFSGPYLESAADVSDEDPDFVMESLQRSWVESGPELPHWDGWTPYQDGSVTQYSGLVGAELQAADGQRMSCRFQLNAPLEGMTGGGQGTCQLNNGRSAKALFPPLLNQPREALKE